MLTLGREHQAVVVGPAASHGKQRRRGGWTDCLSRSRLALKHECRAGIVLTAREHGRAADWYLSAPHKLIQVARSQAATARRAVKAERACVVASLIRVVHGVGARIDDHRVPTAKGSRTRRRFGFARRLPARLGTRATPKQRSRATVTEALTATRINGDIEQARRQLSRSRRDVHPEVASSVQLSVKITTADARSSWALPPRDGCR
jgi:hypothetical protein